MLLKRKLNTLWLDPPATQRRRPVSEELKAEECSGCRFYLDLSPNGQRGVCRRYPPMPITTEFAWMGATYMEADRADAVWPMVGVEDWCGEYTPSDSNGGGV
jgi:hypothetical protein